MTQHTDHTPPTDQQLDEITARAAHLFEYVTLPTEVDQLAGVDVPLLLADLRRARDRVAELEAYAYGCDAEGCVLPHSSWCDAAKKTATANEGCTCGKPWTGHPQPHAMHCWTVNPPRVEVEEMRKRIAELTAENAKLIRWHHEDGAAFDRMRATIARLRARITELEGRDADITERGCPGFEREYQGVSDAKRRLANCKHCGKPRTGHAPAAASAAGGAR